jgi:hypothetical protein
VELYAMSQGKRIVHAVLFAALLLSTVSSSAFAAKAADPEGSYWCITIIVPMCVWMP